MVSGLPDLGEGALPSYLPEDVVSDAVTGLEGSAGHVRRLSGLSSHGLGPRHDTRG